MATQDNVSIARTMYDAYNDGNLDRTANCLAPDAIWTDVASGRTFHGPEGFKQFIQGVDSAFPDAKIVVTNQVGAGDWVITEFRCRGTHTGTLMTSSGAIPPTQRHMDLSLCDVVRFRDGKVVEGRTYSDLATVMSQLGLMPAESTSRAEHREDRPYA